jgi:hypothetical protein
MARIPDLDDFLDPKSLSPQQLYTLQSETWAQGAEAERERIIKLIEDNEYELTIIGENGVKYELDDFLIALIKGEQK